MKKSRSIHSLICFGLLCIAGLQSNGFCLTIERIGSYQTGVFDEGAAEIIDYDPGTGRIFSVNSNASTVDIIQVYDDGTMSKLESIDCTEYGDGANSLAFKNGLLAIAIEAGEIDQRGKVVFFDADGNFLKEVDAGFLPDMLTFTNSGRFVLVANEGEPSDDYSIDPAGSVTLIDLTRGVYEAVSRDITFEAFNDKKDDLISAGVRIFGGVSALSATGFDPAQSSVTLADAPETGWIGMFAKLLYSIDDEEDTEGYMIDSVDVDNNKVFFSDDLDADMTEAGILYLYDRSATVAEDLEPEYIAVSGDDRKAIVSLQENNAFAILDLDVESVDDIEITEIKALGFKDHSREGNGLDGSEDDNDINITTWPVWGMYQPDAICSFVMNGTTYYLSANEGDARDYDAFTEEVNIEDMILDEEVFSDADDLQLETAIGGLDATITLGDTDGDGDFDEIYVYGGRSFSVWDSDVNLIWDSGDDFEQITADSAGQHFNASNDDHSLDDRSGNKGPEPEAVTTGFVNGTPYAFIALERIGGVMVYDMSDPQNPAYVTYFNNRDFDAQFVEDMDSAAIAAIGDLGPECVRFIPSTQNPTGHALLAVSNEVSGSISLYRLGEEDFTCTILHNNDAESRLTNLGEDLSDYGGAAAFAALLHQTRSVEEANNDAVVLLSSGDNFLAGPQFNVSLEREEGQPLYDAVAMDSMDYDAVCIGNHDFDFGPDILARFIESYQTNTAPYLGANLDFSEEPALQDLADQGRILPSTVIGTGDARIGVIGAVTPEIVYISSPGDVAVDAEVTDVIQHHIDSLTSLGVNKIVVISHLQSVNRDTALAATLENVDVIIAGGGDELLSKPTTLFIPGDSHDEKLPYPIMAEDAQGNILPIVTTSGQYGYLGLLSLSFDADGKLVWIDDRSGPIRVASGDTILNAVDVHEGVNESVVSPVQDAVNSLAEHVIGNTEVDFDAVREHVRTRETNAGNLITDALKWQATVLAEEYGVTAPDIAIQNGGGIRNSVEKNAGDDITELTIWDMCPFSNFVSVIEELTAEELKLVLENAVSQVENVDGRFAQISGMKFTYDPEGTALELDDNGEVVTEGERVLDVELDDGTKLVEGGTVIQDAPMVSLAIANFLADGGDQYPLTHKEYTRLPATYQQAVSRYIQHELDGQITEEMYPAGGEGRIATPSAVNSTGKNFLKNGFYIQQKSSKLTKLIFSIEKAGDVRITLFDLKGRLIKTALRGKFDAGRHTTAVDISDLAGGLYITRFRSDSFVKTQELNIIK